MKKILLTGKKYLIPSNLNMAEILVQSPPSFDYSLDYFIYIINLIYKIPSRNKKIACNFGYVPINAQALQCWVRNYREYLDYLVTNDIFEENRHYSVEKKQSRSFRLGEKYYKTCPVEATITNHKLLRKIEKKSGIKQSAVEKYPNLWNWFNEKLCIDSIVAQEFCQTELHVSENTAREDFLSIQCIYEKIFCLKNGHYWFTVDSKGNRLHTNFTNLDSSLKKFITYDGKELVAVDIKNSQPFLSVKILKDFYQSQYQTTCINQPSPIMLVNLVKGFIPSDVEHYIDLVVSGDFYEFMITKFKEKFGDIYFQRAKVFDFDKKREVRNTKTPRQQVKTAMFCIFFSQNKWVVKEKKLFKEIFPNVMHVFEEIKKHHHNALACELQRLEASLILDKVCAEISLNAPCIPMFTIHDSIVTTRGYEAYVHSVLKKYFHKEIGYEPQVKYEYWQGEELKKAA